LRSRRPQRADVAILRLPVGGFKFARRRGRLSSVTISDPTGRAGHGTIIIGWLVAQSVIGRAGPAGVCAGPQPADQRGEKGDASATDP
jgi:hypothetical protein